jgi:pyridoxal 5'-phosphate synthase pdxS subunit
MMQLGAESVFVGSGIFKSNDPQGRAGLGEAMKGIEMKDLPEEQRLQHRGW